MKRVKRARDAFEEFDASVALGGVPNVLYKEWKISILRIAGRRRS